MPDNNPDNPRLITFAEAQERYGGGGGSSNLSVIDLGIINTARITAAGNLLELMPYTAGRLVHRIIFSVSGFEPFNPNSGSTLSIFTPNTVKSGLARITSVIKDTKGTGGMGLLNDGATGNLTGAVGPSGDNIIPDRGPILALFAPSSIYEFMPTDTWVPNTKWALYQVIVDSDGGIQYCTTPGTGGSEEPTWNNASESDTTSDGTATWTCGVIVGNPGAIHAYAEVSVVTGATDGIPVATTTEFVQQPTDVVAEETINPAIQVRVLDQNGDPYRMYNGGVTIAIRGAGTLAGTAFQDISGTTGIAVFNDLAITEPGTYQLLVRGAEIMTPTIISDPFDVTAP